MTQEYDNLICGTNAADFNYVFVVGDATYQSQCASRSYADWIKRNLPADIESTDIKIYNSLRCTEVMEFEKKLNETLYILTSISHS